MTIAIVFVVLVDSAVVFASLGSNCSCTPWLS